MKYGYARVSTDDQNAAMQLAALKKDGCKKIFTDKGISGAASKAPSLLRLLKVLKAGDSLVIWKLDRLGRSTGKLVLLLDELKQCGVKIKSLTEHIDTETPAGRAMWQILAIMAEMEHGLIRERTKAGIADARRRGVKFGRKPKLSRQQVDHAVKLIEAGEPPAQVADTLQVSKATLYRSVARKRTTSLL